MKTPLSPKLILYWNFYCALLFNHSSITKPNRPV